MRAWMGVAPSPPTPTPDVGQDHDVLAPSSDLTAPGLALGQSLRDPEGQQ